MLPLRNKSSTIVVVTVAVAGAELVPELGEAVVVAIGTDVPAAVVWAVVYCGIGAEVTGRKTTAASVVVVEVATVVCVVVAVAVLVEMVVLVVVGRGIVQSPR